MEERRFKASIVWLIVNGKTEEALERLAEHYGVEVPKLKVGLPKGHRARTRGCYDPKSGTISVLDSDVLKQPFTVLHEFYHHTRTGLDARHRGTERYANEFALEFIQAYKSVVTGASGNSQ